MARHKEPLTGPVVSRRDAGLLNPGELAAARNCHWLPGTPALTRMRGRTLSGTVSATAVDVVGLRDATFDNGDQILIAHASASYLTGVVGDSVTFGVLATGLGVGAQLEAVQYRNRYFLFNGTQVQASSIGSNRAIYLSATAASQTPILRQHGMLPVDGANPITTAAGTAAVSVTGYYEYWTTEVAKIIQDGTEMMLESTFVGDPATVFISTTSQVPVIEMPSIKNPAITTHWRIYRSPKKDSTALTDREFPIGFMVAENATAQATAQDTAVVTSTGFIFPANFNGVGGDGATVYTAWANAATLSADNGAYASATVAASPGAFAQYQGVYGFNFGGFTGTVKGIEVEVQGYISSGTGPVPIEVRIGRKRKSTGSFIDPGFAGGVLFQLNTVAKSVQITATGSGSPQTVTLGSSSDRWFPPDIGTPFNSSDFGTDFMAVLGISKPGTSIGVDYIRVKVHYAATFDSVVQFPTVVYTFGDITSQVGKNGPPPSSDTGDLFEDSLVVNDKDNPSLVRYSFPGEPESFPSTYFIDFETQENDRVRCIKVVNDRCMVWLDSSTWRLEYLPNERDAQFDRGKSKHAISRQHGCVNPMCVAIYSPDGGVERAAFVSDQGIFDTNAYDLRELTDDIDWRGTVAATAGTYAPIALINDRERRQLLYYFQNTNDYGNETHLCLPLCYAPEHMTDGKPKAGGILHMRNYHAASSGRGDLKSAWPVPRSNGDTQVYLGYGGSSTAAGAGTVYRENGTAVPAESDTMRFIMRRMYLADLGNEWEGHEVYGYAGSYTGSPVVTYSINGSKCNDAGVSQLSSKAVTLAGSKLHRTSHRWMSEGAQISATVASASAYAQEFIVIEGEGWGMEDSGK